MHEIERVAILGAGAIGASVAARFGGAAQISTQVVARGERRRRLLENGLVVNGKRHDLYVVDPDDVPAPADLVIVALKHHHLAEAAADLMNLVGADTVIISLMNGLGSEEYLGSIYGMERMLYAIIVGIDALREGNRVHYTNTGTIYFGEADNAEISHRVRRVQDAFERAGLPSETPVDMIRMLWWKFMINVGINQASAVMRAPFGTFQRSNDARSVMQALMSEVIVLAQRAGVDLGEQDIADWHAYLETLSPQGKTSMLQDIEAARKTEVEVFGRKVVELGQSLGVPTPVNETMLRVIRVLEERAAPMPD